MSGILSLLVFKLLQVSSVWVRFKPSNIKTTGGYNSSKRRHQWYPRNSLQASELGDHTVYSRFRKLHSSQFMGMGCCTKLQPVLRRGPK